MNDINALLPDIKLRFNIAHPTFEECYLHGYESALAERGEEDNPFVQHSKESEQWLEGWWAGFYGERPIYTLEDAEPSVNLTEAVNDESYPEANLLTRVLEIAGIIAVSAAVGYQFLDLVA